MPGRLLEPLLGVRSACNCDVCVLVGVLQLVGISTVSRACGSFQEQDAPGLAALGSGIHHTE